MTPEFKGNFAQKIGYHIVSRTGNALRAGIDATFCKDNFKHLPKLVNEKRTKWENIIDNYDLSYNLRMIEDARSPNKMSLQGWATIIVITAIVASTLIVNSR